MSEIKKPDIYKMNLPADLKKLSTAQCEELCGDIRKILIDTVCKNSNSKRRSSCVKSWYCGAYNGYPQSF